MSVKAPEDESMLPLLVFTKKGRVVVLMAFMYTVIVSMSLSILYFSSTALLTVIATVSYALATAIIVYLRAPMPRMRVPALVLIGIVPSVVAWGVIGILTVVT